MIKTNGTLCETHIIGTQTREWIISPRICPALTRHHVALAGISEAAAGFRFVRLAPAMAQALVCIEGKGKVLVNGRWKWCGPGMAYLTPPRAQHAYHAVANHRWRMAWVIYQPGADSHPVFPFRAPLLAHLDPKPLESAIWGLYQETNGLADPLVMQHWMELIHAHVVRTAHRTRGDERLGRLWESVDANLAHPWNNAALAKIACVSAEHLRRLCRQFLGCSPMAQVTSRRIHRAAGLLIVTNQKIETIAGAVGYRNAFAFSSAFKRLMGLSPQAYRKKLSPSPATAGWNGLTLDI
ncbi:MAG: AraC family transcriptional regulator [Verrucomicrobiae bacterium]|nr:AraC family transcriptional regulator [Verrucomicrobiae bacterium]